MSKILFIGDGYPIANNAGSILYQKLIKYYGVEYFCYYAVGYKSKFGLPEEFEEMTIRQSSLRIFSKNRLYRILKKIPLIEEIYYFVKIPFVCEKIIKFIELNNVVLIICVLRADGLAIINNVLDKTGIPLLGFISDTVEAEFTDKKRIYNIKLKEYLKAIKASKAIYVAGESMQNYIEDNFGKKSSIIRLGFEDKTFSRDSFTNEISIFFAGSIYAYEEFESFTKALDKFSQMHDQFKIRLITATNYNIKSKTKNIEMVILGWQNEHQLYSHMKECHIGYIPYKFDPLYKNQMQYAFPNKTGFYLSSGLPIFFHGPAYSSMSYFFEKYECGIHCTTLQVEDIITDLEKLIFDKEFYNKCLDNAKIAYKNEFTIEVMKNNFKELIEYALSNQEYTK